MEKITCLFKLLALLSLIKSLEAKYYEEDGPDSWFINYPTCAGLQQSPINIESSNIIYDASLKPFEFFNYNYIFDMELKVQDHNSNLTLVYLYYLSKTKYCVFN